ncbi:MAG: SagB/ThcOx family dehydrogenase [bacterium]|nr:SagB/ThcOx family dehydrogenase [bacterium]
MSTSTHHRLPEPRLTGDVSVEEALNERRSRRSYAAAPLSLAEVSQLLWSAQGITDQEGDRTAPSAGATHPLELFLVAGEVTGLKAGIYRYLPQRHELVRTAAGNRCAELAAAATYQGWVRTAPAAIVIAAVEKRTAASYGRRAALYVHMEAGAVTENVHLQAEALGLATVVVGAFDDRDLKAAVGLEAQEEPLALMPVGRRS